MDKPQLPDTIHRILLRGFLGEKNCTIVYELVDFVCRLGTPAQCQEAIEAACVQGCECDSPQPPTNSEGTATHAPTEHR